MTSSSTHPLYSPGLSSALGMLALRGQGNDARVGFYIPDNIEDSSELTLSPDDIQNVAENTKFGPSFSDLFGEVPEAEEFLSVTKKLATQALNANLQFKLDDNLTFDDFLKFKDPNIHSGFEIPYYPFDNIYASNGFSHLINTSILGSYIVGVPNYFVEAEFWDNIPLLEGFDGLKYDHDIITKPYYQVGKPTGLSDEQFVELLKQKTGVTGSNTGTGSSSGSHSKDSTSENALLLAIAKKLGIDPAEFGLSGSNGASSYSYSNTNDGSNSMVSNLGSSSSSMGGLYGLNTQQSGQVSKIMQEIKAYNSGNTSAFSPTGTASTSGGGATNAQIASLQQMVALLTQQMQMMQQWMMMLMSKLWQT